MWTLSGFADEIDPDLQTQCDVLTELGIGYLEFRSAWEVNVLDLSDEQVDKAHGFCPPTTCPYPPSDHPSGRSTSRTTSTSI